MILIACTDFSSKLVQPLLLKELLVRNGFEVEIYIIGLRIRHFNIIVTEDLIKLIRQASLILLFVQPYPIVDWEDPFDTFFTTIYSFISSLPITKSKTVYVTPFVIGQLRDSKVSIQFMEGLVARAKLGHFEIHPSNSIKFLNYPPMMDQYSYRPVTPNTLLNLYDGLLELCQERIKKSN